MKIRVVFWKASMLGRRSVVGVTVDHLIRKLGCPQDVEGRYGTLVIFLSPSFQIRCGMAKFYCTHRIFDTDKFDTDVISYEKRFRNA
jgi:hypothetical protein